jgi:hypothetical protein
MRYFIWTFFILLSFQQVHGQDSLTQEIDSLYREDQFYVGVTLNFLSNTPPNASRSGFSSGFRIGFLRDMPISKNRRFAIAIGGGLSYDQFRHNILIQSTDNNTQFTIISEDVTLNKNRLSMATIEMPIELRFRTSNPTQYEFFRIYAGFSLGYTFWQKALYEADGTIITATQLPEFNKVRLATTLSVGFDSFNAFIYYDLSTFFKDSAKLSTQEKIGFNALKLGLIFYVL